MRRAARFSESPVRLNRSRPLSLPDYSNMLRLRRLTQLLIVLCMAAFISALLSFAFHRVLSMSAMPFPSTTLINDLQALEDIGKLREVAILLVRATAEVRTGGEMLVQWGLGFVLVWSLILGVITAAVYRQIGKVQSATEIKEAEKESLLDRACAGKLELWKVFWGGYISLSCVLTVAAVGVFQLLRNIGSDTQASFLLNALVGPIVLAIPMAIYFCCAALVWRSAPNTTSPLWGYAARSAVIVLTVVPLLKCIYSASVFLKLFS